jgi:hypothetical protein
MSGHRRSSRPDSACTGQRRAGELEGVVEPLAFGAVVFRAGLLAQRLGDRAERGSTPGGEVAADDRRAAERDTDLPWRPAVGPCRGYLTDFAGAC